MKRFSKYYRWLIVALAVAIFIWQSQSSSPVTENTDLQLPEEIPDVYMTDMDLIRYSETGEPDLKVTASTVSVYNDSGQTLLSEPDVLLFNSSDNEWKITAVNAIVYENDDIEFFNDVYVQQLNSQPITVLQSDYLKVTEQGNLIVTDHPVQITQGKQIVNAVGMTLNTDTIGTTIHLESEVSLIYDPT